MPIFGQAFISCDPIVGLPKTNNVKDGIELGSIDIWPIADAFGELRFFLIEQHFAVRAKHNRKGF